MTDTRELTITLLDDPLDDDHCPPINQNLPSWALEKLRYGVGGYQPDFRDVFNVLVSIAMSCRRRGWSNARFVNEVMAREERVMPGGKRRIGYWQLTVDLITTVRGCEGRAEMMLHRVWDQAGDNILDDHVLKTTADYLDEVVANAWAWDERLDRGVDNALSVTEVEVMRYVTASVDMRRNRKVTCPCRDVGAHVGVPYRTAYRTLKGLEAKGFLRCHSRGSRSDDPKYRRAATYSLADAFELPYHQTPGRVPKCGT